ncbi:MAG: AMP-binding protein [Gemmataceae bacterium]
MLGLLRTLLWLFARCLISLRYRVRVQGLEKVRHLPGPLLILPNHPAFIDPPTLMTWLFPVLHPRPLLFEGNFTNPLMRFVAVLLDALKVPDLDQTSAEARKRTTEAIEGVKEALRGGRNVILWPSGRLQRDGIERLGAARTLSDVLKGVPQAQMVLVRTRGLWGSRFSYGWDGNRPALGSILLKGLGIVLSNLIFFCPRREVTLTLEAIDRKRLPGLEREQLNPWLEQWYNIDPETPKFVPAHFLFGPRTREFPRFQEQQALDLSALKPETRQAVNAMLEEKLGRALSSAELAPDTLLESLGMDSLDRQDFSLQVEKRFGFRGDTVPANLSQVYALAGGFLPRTPPKPPAPLWFQPPSSEAAEILGDTIPAAAVERALRCRRDVTCADDNSGVLTYERFLVGALNLAEEFRKLPGTNVGVMLPSSVACDVTLLGLYLAGKLPVVLNWTTGPANLAHAAQLMELQVVVTSKAFVDRVDVQAIGSTRYFLLEQVRKNVSKVRLLGLLLRVRYMPGWVRRQVPAIDPDAPAVVLFTSGSEKAPKAVPLSHRNILTNQRGGIPTLKVSRSDSILGFLPPFHSFGMSITGFFPILGGLKVVRHPDPTDASALARKVGLYKPTILVGTPTFISYILDRAEPGELTSLRMVVLGAEKCPPAVFERVTQAAPRAEILEGYGITECSPVVAVNPAGAPRANTVGKPMPEVEVCVVDLESGEPVPQGQMGMLLVAGPTVFAGYLGGENPSPFRDHAGKRWYVTGDLVELDADGYIRFSGRLKRFIKAGGEMISLPALEEPFQRLYPPTKDGPRVAVEGIEVEGGGRRIVLFTTEELALREANELLVREGFHGVMRLDEVRRVEALPVLGTGKTDYKVLRAQISVPVAVGHPA